MASESTKSIPEALLKLKAALEDGKRDEVIQSVRNEKNSRSAVQKKTKGITAKPVRPVRDFVPYGATKIQKEAPIQSVVKIEQADLDEKRNTKKNVDSKHVPLSQNERVKAALSWLCETFPNLFSVSNRRPLKIGITQDVAAWIDEQRKLKESAVGDAVRQGEENVAFMPSKTAVRDAITVYTNALQYQKALLKNDKRYDLDGNEVGVVEEKQKEHADQRNAKIEAAIQAQAEKREALRERRKMIAEAWRIEKEAKRNNAALIADSDK